MNTLRDLSISTLALATLYLTFNYTKAPNSWQEASYPQLLLVFIPILTLFTFIPNLFLKYLPQSFIIGLGLFLCLIFYLLNIYVLLTIPFVLAITLYFSLNFPKIKFKKKLTQPQKIPKLTRIKR